MLPQTIFLSSTYEDLKEYRQKAIDVIVSLRQTFEGMEYFGADNRTPLDVCLEKLSFCQIYVCIVGMRYGSVEKASGKSYTEIEYEKAKELGLPCYIYIIDEENARISPKFVDRNESADKLDVFKNRLRSSHVCKKFSSPENLGEALQHDLPIALEQLQIAAKRQEAEKEEQSKSESNNEADDYRRFQKFLLRPVKYHGTVVNLSMKMKDNINGWRLKTRIVKAFGLPEGDTASCEVSVTSPDGGIESVNQISRNLTLYFSGDIAEWLIDNNACEGATINGKVKLMSARLNGITEEGGIECTDYRTDCNAQSHKSCRCTGKWNPFAPHISYFWHAQSAMKKQPWPHV